MSIFHSNVSRREFMKGLGLAGAGVGGAALVQPQFHDIDELISSSNSLQKRPWYVKERELFNPTEEVDWQMMKRYDRAGDGQSATVRANYYGLDRVNASTAKGNAILSQRLQAGESGWSHKWVALRNGILDHNAWTATHTGPAPAYNNTLSLAKTPAELGVPKWTGTPEEASRMMIAAARLYGGGMIGFQELDDHWRNHLFHSGGTQPLVYEDVDQGYYTSGTNAKFVVPTKPMYLIVVSGPEPRQTDRSGPSQIAKNNLVANTFLRNGSYYGTWNFLRGLGYQSLGRTGHPTDNTHYGSSTVLSGLAENSRQGNWVLSPETGAFMYIFTQTIDLPVAPTNPIDAGMWRWCHTCKKCAEHCPAGALDLRDAPTYEMPPIEGKADTQHNPGVKHFWFNGSLCNLWIAENGVAQMCSTCSGNCTFTIGNEAMLHTVLRSTISTTSTFNGFFYGMSKSFGFGGSMADKEDWWNTPQPLMGIDSTIVVGNSRK